MPKRARSGKKEVARQPVTEALEGKFKSFKDYGNATQDPQTADETCRICGLPREQWPAPEGYEKNGEAYCCEGCAEGSDCTCMSDEEKQRLMEEHAERQG